MAKKILVISMKAGWGHIKAAQALEEYAKNSLAGIEIIHADLCQIEPALGKFFEIFYEITNDHLPSAWGTVYSTFDKEPVSAAFRRANGFQRLFRRRISRFLRRLDLSGVIFTNVIPAPMVAPPCREIFPNIPLAVVVTDYHGHSYYNVPLIDRYFVAIPEVKDDLVRVGIDSQKIEISGIPVDQKFYQNYNKAKIKRRLGFDNGAKTVLFISRLSKDFVVPALEGILRLDPEVNLIAVCGGNNQLCQKIKESVLPRRNFKLVNWTARIDEYMKISDVVVTKPGGLVISECLALGKKIIMTDPIPGQEERNAEFIAKYNYGIMARDHQQIVAAVVENLRLPESDLSNGNMNACASILDFFR